jgi:hypothetical protein
MLITRAVASIASIMLGLSAALLISTPQKASAQVIYACTNPATGLLYIVAANGTCPPGWTLLSWPSAPAASSPPLFQGIMVDAKGKTVGRFVPNPIPMQEPYAYSRVIRQINGIWVQLTVDAVAGFPIFPPTYFYQSSDCTGQAYLLVNPYGGTVFPAQGFPAIVPPATQPSIYFAGTPTLLTLQSGMGPLFPFPPPPFPPPGPCRTYSGSAYVGLPQSVPVSSLGLTLPFSIK